MTQHIFIEALDTICDFCSTPDPQWIFDAREAAYREMGESVPGMHHMDADGLWGACDACKALILARENAKLAERSVDNFYKLHPEVPKAIRPEIIAGIRQIHNFFFTHYRGEEPKHV